MHSYSTASTFLIYAAIIELVLHVISRKHHSLNHEINWAQMIRIYVQLFVEKGLGMISFRIRTWGMIFAIIVCLVVLVTRLPKTRTYSKEKSKYGSVYFCIHQGWSIFQLPERICDEWIHIRVGAFSFFINIPGPREDLQCASMPHNERRYNAMLYDAMRCDAIRCNSMLYDALRIYTMHCDAIRCECDDERCYMMLYDPIRCYTMQDDAIRCYTMLMLYDA